MARKHAKAHPCEGREPLHPWRANHLYIGDDGRVLCGRCMGVESTYRLGAMSPARSITVGPLVAERGSQLVSMGPMTMRCETDAYAAPRERE